MITSSDFTGIFGFGIFDHFLERGPTSTENTAVTAGLTAGDYDEAVLDVVASSAYYTANGSTNADFVTSVYQDLLSRNPDAGGLSYWTDQLDTAAKTRRQVAQSFLNGNESVTLLVHGPAEATSCVSTSANSLADLFVGAYCVLLDRMADSTGAAYWIGELTASTDNVPTLMVSFTASAEYYNNS